MGSINQTPHETHFQKYDLDNLVKALALDSTEFPYFKNEGEDSGFTAAQKNPHKCSPGITINPNELPHSRLSKDLSKNITDHNAFLSPQKFTVTAAGPGNATGKTKTVASL